MFEYELESIQFEMLFETCELVSELHFDLSGNFVAEHCSSKYEILHLNQHLLVSYSVGRAFMFLGCSNTIQENSYLGTGWTIDCVRTCKMKLEQPVTRHIKHILALHDSAMHFFPEIKGKLNGIKLLLGSPSPPFV